MSDHNGGPAVQRITRLTVDQKIQETLSKNILLYSREIQNVKSIVL